MEFRIDQFRHLFSNEFVFPPGTIQHATSLVDENNFPISVHENSVRYELNQLLKARLRIVLI
jgi:hypothetical protein